MALGPELDLTRSVSRSARPTSTEYAASRPARMCIMAFLQLRGETLPGVSMVTHGIASWMGEGS